jgi:hypothetical protein
MIMIIGNDYYDYDGYCDEFSKKFYSRKVLINFESYLIKIGLLIDYYFAISRLWTF